MLFLVCVVLDSRTLARVRLAGRNRMNLSLLSRRLVDNANVTLLLARLYEPDAARNRWLVLLAVTSIPCVRTVRALFPRALNVIMFLIPLRLLEIIRLAIHYLLVNLMFLVMYRRYSENRTRRLTWLVVQVVWWIGLPLKLPARFLKWCRVTRLLLACENVMLVRLSVTIAVGVRLVSSPVVLRLIS